MCCHRFDRRRHCEDETPAGSVSRRYPGVAQLGSAPDLGSSLGRSFYRNLDIAYQSALLYRQARRDARYKSNRIQISRSRSSTSILPVSLQTAQIPLYSQNHKGKPTLRCLIPVEFALRNESFLRLIRTRQRPPTKHFRKGRTKPVRVIEAHVLCLPGFLQHLVSSFTSTPCPTRYGMSMIQELPSGHVLYALAGTIGS